jgi:hypothetical protein
MTLKVKSSIQNLKFYVLAIMLVSGILCLVSACLANEITIIYAGETHAMLYNCNCPKEPDGGVSRRATLIKQLRKANPYTLVLDSGGFFAGGLMDEYTQNTQLDMQRTLVNLKAMELIKYDATAIGDDEFNFGRDFLFDSIGKTNLTFLSCNIESDKVSGYIIKEVAGTKVGIIGVTGLSAMQKAADLKFIEPKIAVGRAVEELKKKGSNIIVLLSHLGESDDLKLIKECPGIDIIVTGHSRAKEEPFSKIGSTLVLRPSWQGRKLGKLSLVLEDNKIKDFKVEELRLSDKISDDGQIASVLPRCFSDDNCKKEAMTGICQESGSLKSNCKFSEASKIQLSVILPRSCRICDTERMIKYLKAKFAGLVISYLYWPSAKANKMIKDRNIKALPVYLLGKEIEKDKGFDSLKENLEPKGNFYMIKPSFSGISYFSDREKIKGRLDLFISLYDKNASSLLEMIKEFNPAIHFLAIEKDDKFEAAKGSPETEEYLRCICVQKYYPQKFWDYISCRTKNINSSWWDDCLAESDTNKIRTCAHGEEGKTLLKENISLNKELQVMFGPSYLLDNQEIFATQGVPPKEDFRKILNIKR